MRWLIGCLLVVVSGCVYLHKPTFTILPISASQPTSMPVRLSP